MTVGDLDRIFKAYDVRGVVPDDLDEDIARRIGAAFAEWSGGPRVVIGRDCRLSSPELAAALTDGITSRGVGVVDVGLASTDLLYFASGSLDLPAHHAHRQPQPQAVQRAEVLPGRSEARWGRRAGSSTSGR